MKLTIEDYRGIWKAQVENRSEFGATLEELLQKIVPDAPEDYIWRTAEVLGTVLGAEVVPTAEINYQAIADAMWGSQDDPDHWEYDRSTHTAPELEDARPSIVEAIQEYTEPSQAREVPGEYRDVDPENLA